MKLDPKELEAAAKAHRQRLASPLWDDGESSQATELVTAGDVQSTAAPPTEPPTQEAATRKRTRQKLPKSPPPPSVLPLPVAEPSLHDIWASLQSLESAVSLLQQAQPQGADHFPTWLMEAAGNPKTYDAPDPSRKNVCVRVLPTSYAQIQQVQQRLKLRTVAGTWELMLRLGIAAAFRLPTGESAGAEARERGHARLDLPGIRHQGGRTRTYR